MNTVNPRGLVKKLMGENLVVTIGLNPKINYEVFVDGNMNVQKQSYQAIRSGLLYQVTIPLTQSGFFSYKVRYRRYKAKSWRQIRDHKGRALTGQVQVDPAWLMHAIIYCVFVRFFKGKVKEGEMGRLPGTQKSDLQLDELKDKSVTNNTILPGEGGTFDDVKAHLLNLRKMHVNVLYFNPIHTIGEIFRGYNMLDQLPPYLQPGSPYSIKDYKAIDPELSYDKETKNHLLSDPQQEFLDLVQAAHDLGMFVILDLVFNHTAHDFVFQRMHPEWYLYKQHVNSLEDPYLYPEDISRGLPWGDPHHSLAPYDHGVWWEDCAQLNWEYKLAEAPNDPPPNYGIRSMWEFFKSIPQYWVQKYGVDGFRADVAYRVPNAFWKATIAETRDFARRVKTNLSHDVIFIAESYTDELNSLQAAGFTAVYGDFSHKLANPVTLKGYLDYIYNLSGDYFPLGSKWFHFPDSHDFDRTPRKVLPAPAITTQRALLANESRWILTATLPGVPLIFNGFEKIEWQPINIWSYGAINWQKEADLQGFIARVNNLRRHSVALQKGTYQYLETNQGLNERTQIFAFIRTYKEERIVVIVNMDVMNPAGPATVYLPEIFKGKYTLLDQLTDKRYEREGCSLQVCLEPGKAHIFRVEAIDKY